MKRLDVVDNKSTNSSNLYANVLVFCLQEIVSLAGLVYDLSEKQSKDTTLVSGLLSHCSGCIRDSFHDTNMQVK
jgi:uncharacterized protein YuzB (UPF0349 family)